VFIALTTGEQEMDAAQTDLVNRTLLAERMKWTLDYIDSLDVTEYQMIRVVLEARDAALAHRAKTGG
jgi:hypothetical protein